MISPRAKLAFARRLRAWAALTALCSLPLTLLHARQLEGIEMADQTEIGGRKLVLNGLGMREATLFHVHVYVGGLYVEKPSHDPQEILGSSGYKKIQLKFVRDVDNDHIRNAWREGLEKNAKPEMALLEPSLQKLQGLMRDMKKGETLAFNLFPEKVEVLVDGNVQGTVEGGSRFSRALLSVWLGDPPNEKLKKGMLGL
jgi:hypothetical protein